MSYCHTNASDVFRSSSFKIKGYSNIFLYKTTGPLVLKLHMEVEVGSGRISERAAVIKIIKIANSTSFSEPLSIFG